MKADQPNRGILTHKHVLAPSGRKNRRSPKGAAKFREETSCKHDKQPCCNPTLPPLDRRAS